MDKELQKVKNEIAANNKLLLLARRKLISDPENTDAQAEFEHYGGEVTRLETCYNTLFTVLATVTAQTQSSLLT
jgi:hypothetical protein